MTSANAEASSSSMVRRLYEAEGDTDRHGSLHERNYEEEDDNPYHNKKYESLFAHTYDEEPQVAVANKQRLFDAAPVATPKYVSQEFIDAMSKAGASATAIKDILGLTVNNDQRLFGAALVTTAFTSIPMAIRLVQAS